MAPTFEILPTEISLQILKNMPDTETLKSLVHASPAFHNVYLMDREYIFTSVTLRELAGRGIIFPSDASEIILRFLRPLGPVEMEISHNTGPHNTTYQKIMNTLYRHIRSNTPIKLDIDACLRLRAVQRTEYKPNKDLYVSVWVTGPVSSESLLSMRRDWAY